MITVHNTKHRYVFEDQRHLPEHEQAGVELRAPTLAESCELNRLDGVDQATYLVGTCVSDIFGFRGADGAEVPMPTDPREVSEIIPPRHLLELANHLVELTGISDEEGKDSSSDTPPTTASLAISTTDSPSD
jgi:hypothetical protein